MLVSERFPGKGPVTFSGNESFIWRNFEVFSSRFPAFLYQTYVFLFLCAHKHVRTKLDQPGWMLVKRLNTARDLENQDFP